MKRLLIAIMLLLFAQQPVSAAAPQSQTVAHSDKVQRILSPGGLEIWLVEDHRLPILSLSFAFRGGMSLDPAGKAGLAHFVSGVLDEGAGPRDSETFQKALADNSIDLSFNAGRDSFDGAIRILTPKRDLAAELLHDSLTSPHLLQKDVDRVRDEIAAEIKRNLADPDWVAQRNFNNTVFAGHPYGQPGYGSLESVATITPDDLRGYVQAHFGRDQLVITATGDIDSGTLGALADKVFGDLRAKAEPFDVPEVKPQGTGKLYVIDKPIPETVLLLGAPAVKRDDPDWYAAEIMNYILGGGGFNSRLMEEVRAKRALTYGVGSSLVPYQHSSLLIISGSTKNEDAAKALDVIREQLAHIASGGVTDAELADAKTYLTGSIPLSMTSTMRVSQMLLSLRLANRPIDYLETVAGKLNVVTKADVTRIAGKLLPPDGFAEFALGQPESLQATGKVVP